MQINYIEKTPTATEFNTLTESVSWGTRENNILIHTRYNEQINRKD